MRLTVNCHIFLIMSTNTILNMFGQETDISTTSYNFTRDKRECNFFTRLGNKKKLFVTF